VSSDSDFTQLAVQLCEAVARFTVRRKAPPAFVSVCDKFIYTKILKGIHEETDDDDPKSAPKPKRDFKVDRKLLKLLCEIVDNIAEESGLGAVGHKIHHRSADFDPRNYGFKKLGDMFRAIPQFETEERPQASGTGRQVYIRWKRKR